MVTAKGVRKMAKRKTAEKPKSSKSAKKKDAAEYGTRVSEKFVPPKGFQKGKDAGLGIFKFTLIGDKIEGKYLGTIPSQRKSWKHLYEIETADGVLRIPHQKSIEDLFELNKVKIGNYILLVLADVLDLSGNRTFKRYEIYLKRK